jgi:flavin-dependent dehydrogenase
VDTCDVLIAGGGPAGSACAWQLRKAGFDVIVVDKATFPRDKVCAGWITPQIVDELQIDVDAYRDGRTFQPITGFRVGLVGAPEAVEATYNHPVSFGIRRCEFDHYLL